MPLRRDLLWDDLAWVRERRKGKLISKGILTTEDSAMVAKYGADGIVVSSHSGRNSDAVPPPIEVLNEIMSTSHEGMNIRANSGIRRGLDVLRYQLRGAETVMLGRLPLWALAAGGEEGVVSALAVLQQENIEGCCQSNTTQS